MEKSLLRNLQRKRPLIDTVHLTKKGPIPSFIDLNTGEYCNRKCVFCPRHDSSIYPNQHLFMKVELAETIVKNLTSIKFKGILNLGSGKGIFLKDIAKVIAKKYKKEVVFSDNKKTTYLVANVTKLLKIYKLKIPKKIEKIIF